MITHHLPLSFGFTKIINKPSGLVYLTPSFIFL
jgi:hypothetical protein